jgi:hypothetical protein
MTTTPKVSPWTFQGKVFDPTTEELKKMNLSGFVYCITRKSDCKRYIGKKSFWSKRTLKGATRRTTLESDWRRYCSSHKELSKMCKANPDDFSREIVALCRTKYSMSYIEEMLQFSNNVLGNQQKWFNDNIQGRFFASKYDQWLKPESLDESLIDNL